MKPLTYIALAGDVLYILWIVYNATDDGFNEIRSIQAVALLGLIVLLIINIVLLARQK